MEPTKQDGVVYKIPCECCECGKLYIDETGRPLQDRIKENIRIARIQTSAVSEYAHNTGHKALWNEVKFIDRDPHYYTRKVKETQFTLPFTSHHFTLTTSTVTVVICLSHSRFALL